MLLLEKMVSYMMPSIKKKICCILQMLRCIGAVSKIDFFNNIFIEPAGTESGRCPYLSIFYTEGKWSLSLFFAIFSEGKKG